MKSSDFYLQEYKNNNLNSFHNKYLRGKNVIDSYLEDYIFSSYLKKKFIFKENPKVLEVGHFSGRIYRKLKKFSKNIHYTEHSKEMLDQKSSRAYIFDWVNDKIDEKLILAKPFNVIVSIGHQLSFSCSIEKGILEMNKLLDYEGLFIFDIWNSNCSSEFDPSYGIEKITYKRIKELLRKNNLEIIHLSLGQSIYYSFPNLCKRLYSKKLFAIIFFPLIKYLEKLLFKFGNLKGNAQNIFCIARKK